MRRLLATTAVLTTAVAGWAVPAEGATAYRYWQYWKVAPAATSWSFAQVGPSSRPADGSVEGWRFGISTSGGDDAPRVSASDLFDAVCKNTPPAAGKKRVAVVIDYGTKADAPPGEPTPPGPVRECVTADLSWTGTLILGKVAAVRFCTSGLVGGINGYPRSECGNVVASTSPVAPKPTPSTPASSAPKPGPTKTKQPTTSPPTTGAPAADAESVQANSPTATGAPSAGTPAPEPSEAETSAEAAEPPLESGTTDARAAAATTNRGRDDSGSPVGVLVAAALLASLLGTAFIVRRRAK